MVSVAFSVRRNGVMSTGARIREQRMASAEPGDLAEAFNPPEAFLAVEDDRCKPSLGHGAAQIGLTAKQITKPCQVRKMLQIEDGFDHPGGRSRR